MFSPFHSFLLFPISGLCVFLFLMSMLSMNQPKLFVYNTNMFSILCMTVFILNLYGLYPYFWCFSSYMWSVLVASMLLWFCFFTSSIFKNFDFTLSHLLPMGSPIFLWYFLISLEIISQIIRPLTLSLRLSCNMMAGHVMISLITNLESISYMMLVVMLSFELMVGMIQSLVYSMLNIIYKKELS